MLFFLYIEEFLEIWIAEIFLSCFLLFVFGASLELKHRFFELVEVDGVVQNVHSVVIDFFIMRVILFKVFIESLNLFLSELL